MKTNALMLVTAVLSMLSLSAFADEAAVTGPQLTIQGQFEAFRSGEDAKAYSFAAPSISQIFPDPGSFMEMVKRGYTPLWQPLDFAFGRAKENGTDQVTQEVFVTAKDGTSWTALYSLVKLPDGSWKINGVQLLKGNGAST
jgi:Domain of unknown function (DUF4864)